MHIRNSNNVNPRFYSVTCHCAGWDLLKAKVLWWILIEASLNIALNHFYTFYPVYLWPSYFISLIYIIFETESINSRTRAVEKGKKRGKKPVNILMHMKKLSRERVRCEAHQHLYPMVERAWLWQSVYHLSYLDQQVRAQVKSLTLNIG